nr:AraC family transcriptional regulator [Clostridia bacterium]
ECGVLCPERDVLRPGKQDHWLQEVKDYIGMFSCCPKYAVPSMVVHAIGLLQRIIDEDRLRSLDPRERQMEKALAMLCDSIDAPMSIREIADAVGMGYECFRKLFKARYGMSPAQFRIARRIEISQRFLRAGNNVKNVALMLGYCDEFAFSKQFKKKTAISPKEYGRTGAEEGLGQEE